MILSTATDQALVAVFRCMAFGNRSSSAPPGRDQGLLRAILKAVDLCAAEPERVAQQLVDGGFTGQYDYALQALMRFPTTPSADIAVGVSLEP